MKMVILFGGGDGGGLIVTDNGVRPIPPFDPEILLTVKAAAAIVNSTLRAHDSKVKAKVAREATALCNLAVEQIEQVVGPLDEHRALVYQDDDGGFTCGSTGKPPYPFPWPPSKLQSVGDLIASGVIERDLVDLMHAAREKKVNLTQVFEHPTQFAKEFNLKLSQRSARDLEMLAPSKVARIRRDTDREIVGFFLKVVEDGRFANTWLHRPYDVAQSLGVKLSDAALEQIAMGGTPLFTPGGLVMDGEIAAGIAWAGICIVVGIVLGREEVPIDEIVQDRSNALKM